VNVRPYRYPPAIKDEIEWQIAGMLDSGVIQHSSSPFSSSVLLVKKKDGSFRYFVDFRQRYYYKDQVPYSCHRRAMNCMVHPGFPAWTSLRVIIKSGWPSEKNPKLLSRHILGSMSSE
jgi:hypothetical protein